MRPPYLLVNPEGIDPTFEAWKLTMDDANNAIEALTDLRAAIRSFTPAHERQVQMALSSARPVTDNFKRTEFAHALTTLRAVCADIDYWQLEHPDGVAIQMGAIRSTLRARESPPCFITGASHPAESEPSLHRQFHDPGEFRGSGDLIFRTPAFRWPDFTDGTEAND